MAKERTFKDILVQIGFNTLITEQIVTNRFNKIDILDDAEEREIDELICHISRWKISYVPITNTYGIHITPLSMQITLHFLSIGKLKLMRCWVLKRQHQGVPILVTNCVICEVTDMLS